MPDNRGELTGKRILVLANSSSGLYDFRLGLLKRLISEGAKVTAALPDAMRVKELRAEGVRCVKTKIDRRGVNPARDMKLILTWLKLMNRLRPHLVLCYTIKPNIYGSLLSTRVKHVPAIVTITGLGTAFERGGAITFLVTVLYRAALKRCSCVFFQNEENRGVFESRGIRAEKTRTVSGSGVDLERHAKEPYPGHEDGVIRFLYVGRIMREKGSGEFLDAAYTMRERYGDRVSFTTIGYSDEENELTARYEEAAEKGLIKMLPYQAEIHPFYREADCVVLPSYHEGMSNVIAEAAATGRITVASDIAGCRELIDDGKTGFLAAPGDAASLTEAMEKVFRLSPRERADFGDAARRKMENEFDRNRVIEAYMEEIHAAV